MPEPGALGQLKGSTSGVLHQHTGLNERVRGGGKPEPTNEANGLVWSTLQSNCAAVAIVIRKAAEV